ncbi:MAG TPA: SDR family oxidoreductase [Ktedonobacterales bacterium]|nr:SDR family oxidoreductase [Ktedonobacterales bacterium]
MMNIAVFGANGPTGRLVTQQALAQGHAVTAITRHPEAFPLRHDHLRVMRGDVFDLASVERAVAGQDAILSTLGVPFSRKPITVYSQGVAHMLQAMKRFGVRRIVCVSSGAAGENRDTGAGYFFDNVLLPIMMSTIGKTTFADMKRMEALVMASGLDWTVVRPSGLFETSGVTDYQVAEDHIRRQFTSRADLADCMLRSLTDDRFLGKIMAVATFSTQPTLLQFVVREALNRTSDPAPSAAAATDGGEVQATSAATTAHLRELVRELDGTHGQNR